MENRMRMTMECIEAIRSKTPRDFPLLCRFTPEEFMPGGLTWNDWKIMAPIMDDAGIDIWSSQPGWHECRTPLVQNSVTPWTFLYLAEELKKVVKGPVIAGYRICDPLVAEQILAEGRADLIGMGRQLMADPEFPNKAKEGRFDEIRPCIATCFGMGRGLEGEERERESQCTLYNCAVNAKGDAEIGAPLKPVTKRKKVFVIGGGPGGMEAAMTAASRGHRVTLYERGDKLGGLLLPGSSPPYKDEIRRLALALETQVKKAGVKVELNTEVTSQLVLDKKPDAVIVATGGKPVVPDIPGVKGKNVVTAIEALKEVAKVGNKVVVIGGGMVGCETAEFLAAKGKEVTLLEMLPKLAIDASSSMRWVLRSRLMEANVTIETSLRAEEITPEGVRGVMEGKTIFYPADTVVLAAGFSPNQELAIQLRDKVSEVHLVGDCVKPRKIYQAIEEGFLAGNKV